MTRLAGWPIYTLVALVFGIVLGIYASQVQSPLLLRFTEIIEPFGVLWLNALRMTVIPLVVSTLIVAVLNLATASLSVRVGLSGATVFAAFLISGGLFSAGFGYALIQLFAPEAGIALGLDLSGYAASEPVIRGAGLDAGGFIPSNPFTALVEGNLIQIVVFSLVLALAINASPGAARQTFEDIFSAISQAMMQLVRWIMLAAPLGVFAMALSFSSQMGYEFTYIIANYLLLICGLLSCAILIMYPITSVLGNVTLREFSDSVLPAQITAVSTRSSVASLPALLEGARRSGHLNTALCDLLLPFAISVFKTNRSISPLFGLLLLAHWYDINLTVVELVVFFLTTLLLSLSSVGLPMGGGAALSLPLYLAVGIPIEGYILMKSVEPIPDVLKTLVNVTADMSATTVINRYSG